MKWIVSTYDIELEIEADFCELKGGLLMFTKDDAILSVFAEWTFCCVLVEGESRGKVVSLVK